jgi:hypothetical protein
MTTIIIIQKGNPFELLEGSDSTHCFPLITSTTIKKKRK